MNLKQARKLYQKTSPLPLPTKFSQSKITTIQRCPRKYYETYIQMLAPLGKAAPLEAGSFVHRFLSSRYQEESMDTRKGNKITGLAEFIINTPDDVKGRKQQDHIEVPKYLAAPIKAALQDLDIESISGDEHRNLKNLLRILVDYDREYPLDREDFKIVASEVEFAREFREDIVLHGWFDLVIEWARGLWIMDHKTTRAVGDGSFLRIGMRPNFQVSTFIWGARESFETCKGLRFNWIQISSANRNYLRDCTTRTSKEMKSYEITLENTIKWVWSMYADMKHPLDPDPWTQHFHECTSYGECIFRKICNSSKEELVRSHDFVEDERRLADGQQG